MKNTEYIVNQNKVRRETWVDNVKVIACTIVVLGHFFQSMVRTMVLPANDLYQWFNQTIYYFHVPLFFICSGYLYQNFSKVNDIYSWIKNILKKLLILGVPYLTFSFATWLLKTLFSSSVNIQIGGLWDTLFFHPTAPYWYLYALFFLFFITPTFRNKIMAIAGLTVALIFKLLGIFGGYEIQALSYILSNEIWFVIGLCLSAFEFKKYVKIISLTIPIVGGITFFFLSIWVYIFNIEHGVINFLLGLLACSSVIIIVEKIYQNRNNQATLFNILSKYTMPIFLMHTLFAAPLRTVLFMLAIKNVLIHVVLGIAISFVGPIIAAIIMKKSKWLEFFLYPKKFIKVS